MPVPRLRIENLLKYELVREGKRLREVPVNKDLSLEIESGEVMIILGPRAAGQSTPLPLTNRLEELALEVYAWRALISKAFALIECDGGSVPSSRCRQF